KLHKLAELWVKGLAFDWNRLYGERKPHRLSLPTYPFAQERYWVPEAAAPTRRLQFLPPQSTKQQNGQFDREYFAKLFRDVSEQSLSVEEAFEAANQKL
ncbi:MAG: hypothetical protein P8Y47_09735, partial [Alphaproteobacteria bacterium]